MFDYIKKYYGASVPQTELLHREVKVAQRMGCIVADAGNYIGVVFYDDPKHNIAYCHPTSEVEYLPTYNESPPKRTRSQQRYDRYLATRTWYVGSFFEWLKDGGK